jgi:hypothetical protein
MKTLGAYQAPWYVYATVMSNSILYQTAMPVVNGSATFTSLGLLSQSDSVSIVFSLHPNLTE